MVHYFKILISAFFNNRFSVTEQRENSHSETMVDILKKSILNNTLSQLWYRIAANFYDVVLSINPSRNPCFIADFCN